MRKLPSSGFGSGEHRPHHKFRPRPKSRFRRLCWETLETRLALAAIPALSGPVAWWSGDGNTNDSAGMDQGTLHGNATYATGVVGQAFSFDGVDDGVEV